MPESVRAVVTTAAASQRRAPEPAAPMVERWRRHSSVHAGQGVLEATLVFRGGMGTSQWQVETEKDPELSGVLRVAIDGFLVGSVERLAARRYAGRWEGRAVPGQPCTRQQDAVLLVLAAEVAARQRYYAARTTSRRRTT